jgi:N-acetylneuraminic acid mutarotase
MEVTMRAKFSAILTCALLVLVFLASAAFAVPKAINYQGYLEDSGGAPINGTVSMTFAIYDVSTGGASLWDENQSSVLVTEGDFSVVLGSVTPIDLPFDVQYYLGVKVAPDLVEMTPRAVLVSVPYAFRAKEADSLAGAGGVPSGFSILGDSPTPPSGYTYTETINLGSDTWAVKAPMPTARYEFAAVEMGGKIYAIGGWDGVTFYAANEEYDPATDTWATKAPMPTARAYLAAAVANGKVYAIGGSPDGTTTLSTNEEYDPATDTWATKAPIPIARAVLAAAEVNGKLYAIGGNDGTSDLSTVEEYNSVTDTWATKAPMPTARGNLAAAVANGKVYAIGGSGAPFANEEYDPVADTWSVKASMPTARGSLAAAEVNGKIYAIGGSPDGITPMVTNEEYDPAWDTWAAKIPMLTARYDYAAVAVNGSIYAIGGQDGTSNLATNEEYDTGVRYVHRKD